MTLMPVFGGVLVLGYLVFGLWCLVFWRGIKIKMMIKIKTKTRNGGLTFTAKCP